MHAHRTWLGLQIFAAVTLLAVAPLQAADAKVTYDDHVQAIFRQKCFNCHNGDKKSGGLDLTNYTNLMLGGSSGAVIEPGDASFSHLYALVAHESEPKMPPNSEKLPAEMLATIQKWIDGGALENSGSKPLVAKPKADLTLKASPTGKPEGPPPMPGRLNLEPVTRTEQTTAVTALATSPWAPLVAVGGQQQVLLYDSQTLELRGVLPFPEGVPHVLKFSRNGALLIAGGGRGAYRGRVVVWDVKTGERVAEVGDEVDTVLAADISADQSRIALGGPSRIVRIYSTSDGTLLHEIKKHTEWVYAVEFSPDGVLLASADRNGGMFVWEAHTAREYLALNGHQAAITGLSWRADSNILASCSEDGTVRLWEMRDGKQVKSWGAHGGGVAAVEFARDGRIVSCGRDKLAKLWDQNGGQQRAFPAFGDIAVQVSFCDEAGRVVAGDWTGALRVFNAADGKQLGELTPNPPRLAERLDTAMKLLATRQAEFEGLAKAHPDPDKTPPDAQAKLAAAKTGVEDVRQAVARWGEAIAFSQRLKLVAGRQSDYEGLQANVQAAQSDLDKIKSDLAAANEALAAAQKQVEAATAAVAQSKQTVDRATGEQAAAAKAVTSLEAPLPILKEALTKAQEAASKSGDDKEIAAAAAGIKSLLDRKTEQLAAARKTLGEKESAVTKAKEQLAAAGKQVESAKSAVTAAQKRVEELTGGLKPAEEKLGGAKQAAEAARQALEQARAALDPAARLNQARADAGK